MTEKKESAPQHTPFIPAQAGIQHLTEKNWIPAFAGMSGVRNENPGRH
jgi:hypothetical protein